MTGDTYDTWIGMKDEYGETTLWEGNEVILYADSEGAVRYASPEIIALAGGEDMLRKYNYWQLELAYNYGIDLTRDGRELVAVGVMSSIVAFFGPGVSFDGGTIYYNGEEYGMASFGFGLGYDISGGMNFVRIYADNPDKFNIYDLEGSGGSLNVSAFFIAYSWDVPSGGENFKDTYRFYSWGGGSWAYTKTKIIPPGKDPTLYDLYRTRPGGYQ